MKTIGTHDGSFHCDEALACFMLKLLPEYADANIVRSRDPATLAACDVVVDVGGVYDPATLRLDHHQRTFTDTMRTLAGLPYDTRLSSAGLVYLHFGKRIITQLTQCDAKTVDVLYDRVYAGFIEEIDAIDNGVSQYDGEPKYRITTTLSLRVSRLAPSWNEPQDASIFLQQFHQAMALAGQEFVATITSLHKHWLPARAIVEQALANRASVDASGEIIELPTACPWKSHLYELEEEMRKAGVPVNIKYAIFEDMSGSWRVMCVSVREGAFENRLSLPEPWCGLRDDKLSEATGIPECIFVHATGFIGGCKTKDAALQLAQKALAFHRK